MSAWTRGPGTRTRLRREFSATPPRGAGKFDRAVEFLRDFLTVPAAVRPPVLGRGKDEAAKSSSRYTATTPTATSIQSLVPRFLCRDTAQAVGMGAAAGRQQPQSGHASARPAALSRRLGPVPARTAGGGRKTQDFLRNAYADR